jgi:hypothetical protein
LKKEKKVGAKVGKKGVSYTTNSLLRRKPCDTGPAPGSENPDFFWPRNFKNRKFFRSKVEKCKKFRTEIFSAGFFPVRNLKIPKKFRAKVGTAGFFWTKIQNAGKILGEQSDSDWMEARTACTRQVFPYPASPPLAPPVPRGGRGAHAMSLHYLHREQHPNAGNTTLSQPGDAHAAGAEACRSPQERLHLTSHRRYILQIRISPS